MEFKYLTLPQLIAKARKITPRIGDIRGHCFVCDNDTVYGHKINDAVSDNFTKYNILNSGNCICPECFELATDQIYRRKSWLATCNEFRLLEKEDKLPLLECSPNPPFFFHFATVGQKQPWYECINLVSYDTLFFYFTTENLGKIMYCRLQYVNYKELIAKAFEKGIKKTELIGSFSAKTWMNAGIGGYRKLLEDIEKLKKNPLWEVTVWIQPYPEKI